jgi:uncharacterized protein YdaU (DUF1376 family)
MGVRPWMPLYVSDYLGDTRRLTTLQHGAYMLLIMEYWQHGGLPDDDQELADIAGLQISEWMEIRPRLAKLFKDGWRHKRIDEELAKASEISDRRKASAERRWSKSNANALQEDVTCNARAGVPQSQPQSQDIPSDSSNELSSGLSPDKPDDAPAAVKSERRKADRELIETVVGEWNALALSLKLPQVSHITEKRQAAVRNRAKELVDYYDYPDPLTGFRQGLFAQIRGSPFLRGEAGDFRTDFDFAFTLSSFTKIMEGRYEGTKANGTNGRRF